MFKVSWALVAYGAIWPPAYSAHIRAVAFASRTLEVEDLGIISAAGATDRLYTHSAENECVREFLESDATHLFLTEQDMLLPKHAIPALLELRKPVASGLYFLRKGRGQPCLYAKTVTLPSNPYPHAPVTLFPLDRPFGQLGLCPGLGCVLIERRVFEAVPEPWFDLAEGKYGSDMYFYTKVKDAGFEVWMHPGVCCDQIDYEIVTIEMYRKRVREDPAWAASGFVLGDAPTGLTIKQITAGKMQMRVEEAREIVRADGGGA